MRATRRAEHPLICSIVSCRSCSPRIVRLLVDAGANTSEKMRAETGRLVVSTNFSGPQARSR